MSHLNEARGRIFRRVVLIATAVSTLMLTGCVTQAMPPYQASLTNQLTLSRLPQLAMYSVTSEEDHPADVQTKLRNVLITAPQGNSWSSYLKDAIQTELTKSGNYKPDATRSIKAELLEFHVADGHADLAAHFVVECDHVVCYDKVLRAHSRWRTSFLATIAMPSAYNATGAIFQDLLRSFFEDPDFVRIS
jgi:hypothetical protein